MLLFLEESQAQNLFEHESERTKALQMTTALTDLGLKIDDNDMNLAEFMETYFTIYDKS